MIVSARVLIICLSIDRSGDQDGTKPLHRLEFGHAVDESGSGIDDELPNVTVTKQRSCSSQMMIVSTVLIVFFIQKTQNRDTQAIHLDELISVTKGARNMMLDLEHMNDESLECLRDIYERLAVGKGG